MESVDDVYQLLLPVRDDMPFELIEQLARAHCDDAGATGPLTYHGKREADTDLIAQAEKSPFPIHHFSATRGGAR